MPCRCGSVSHLRINFNDCPLNPRWNVVAPDAPVGTVRAPCRCSSRTHSRTNHSSSPLNSNEVIQLLAAAAVNAAERPQDGLELAHLVEALNIEGPRVNELHAAPINQGIIVRFYF